MDELEQAIFQEVLRQFKKPAWFLRKQGKHLKVSYHDGKIRRRGGGKRKRVGAFSRASRFRMLQAGAKINWKEIPHSLFLTLTYPDDQVHYDKDVRTTERFLFHRHIENHLSDKIPMLWRTEWKVRLSGRLKGEWAPHMHMLVFGCKYLGMHRMREWWRGIIGAAGALCTDIRHAKNAEQQSLYVAKYCAKVDDSLTLDYVSKVNNPGRHWGFKRPELIPRCKVDYEGWVDSRLVDFLRTAAALHLKWYDKDVDKGFTFIGTIAEKIGMEFLRKELDGMLPLWENEQDKGGSKAEPTDPC